jgi:hypothetical protein
MRMPHIMQRSAEGRWRISGLQASVLFRRNNRKADENQPICRFAEMKRLALATGDVAEFRDTDSRFSDADPIQQSRLPRTCRPVARVEEGQSTERDTAGVRVATMLSNQRVETLPRSAAPSATRSGQEVNRQCRIRAQRAPESRAWCALVQAPRTDAQPPVSSSDRDVPVMTPRSGGPSPDRAGR